MATEAGCGFRLGLWAKRPCRLCHGLGLHVADCADCAVGWGCKFRGCADCAVGWGCEFRGCADCAVGWGCGPTTSAHGTVGTTSELTYNPSPRHSRHNP